MENVNFLHIINRLKTVLGITKDKEVAEALGLKETALNVRKKRNSFPDRELRALAQQRPELGIDVDYVLTGMHSVAAKPAWLRLKAQLGMDDDDEVAQWLGMDVAAVNTYTQRGVFPMQQFKAASEAHPGAVDEDYVLKGVGMAALEIIEAAREGTPLTKVSTDEATHLMSYRECSPKDRETLQHLAAFFAARKGGKA